MKCDDNWSEIEWVRLRKIARHKFFSRKTYAFLLEIANFLEQPLIQAMLAGEWKCETCAEYDQEYVPGHRCLAQGFIFPFACEKWHQRNKS